MPVNYRRIMEEHLGRKLKPSEIVHHIDGNQNNNAVLNLRVIDSQSGHRKEKHPTEEDYIKRLSELLRADIGITAESINKSLSAFFTNRQKELIFKKLLKQELSKTEREYYSRVIKKKLQCLSTPFVQEIAIIVLQS